MQSKIPQPPEIGQRIRIAIRHADEWRPLIWLRAGRDGSIYVGLLVGNPSQAREVIASAQSKMSIKYADLREITVPKSSRCSFHPSGEIHVGDRVVPNGCRPFNDLTGPMQLCLMLFTHPGNYLPPRKKNLNDYDVGVLNYVVDDDRPMYGSISVSTWGSTAVTVPKRPLQMIQFGTVSFGFRGFSSSPDLLISVTIGHGPKGTWPNLPGLIVSYPAEQGS